MATPATPSTLEHFLTDRLREAILYGKYKPGERMNECVIAREYRVSAIPVREALFELQGSGLVTNHVHRGMFVTLLTEEDTQRINSVRIVLEIEALKLARARMTPEIAARLTAVVDKMTVWRGELTEAAALDLEFHRNIWEASGNLYLGKTLESLVTILFAYRTLEKVSYETRQWRLDHHRTLLDVLLNGEEQDIIRAMIIHLRMANKDPDKFSSLANFAPAQLQIGQ